VVKNESNFYQLFEMIVVLLQQIKPLEPHSTKFIIMKDYLTNLCHIPSYKVDHNVKASRASQIGTFLMEVILLSHPQIKLSLSNTVYQNLRKVMSCVLHTAAAPAAAAAAVSQFDFRVP
jgi:hypothetical protein